MTKGYNSNFPNGWSTGMVAVNLNFSSTSTGRKVFDWYFSVAGKRDRIPVEVKAFNNGGDVWFEAEVPHLLDKVRATDINILKEEITERLAAQVNLLTNVEWEDWFEVVVTGDNSDFDDSKYSALGANLKIQVNKLKRGVDPETGRVMTIINGAVTDFPISTRLSDDENTRMSGFRVRDTAERSYIPATVENRRAIDDILSRMEELRNSVADFLSQENIEESLGSDVLLALPRP
jgi:hypothetical protein